MTVQIAIISDIHGNMDALNAVLSDIDKRGIETIHCLGDLVGKGPDGDQAVDKCRDVCEVVLRGNWDTTLSQPHKHPAVQWWQAQLGQERMDYLANLPNVYDFCLSGKQIRLYHASHISEHHRIMGYAPYETHREMFTNTDFTGHKNPEPDIVGYGDIHTAFLMCPYEPSKILFNVGSVGNPLDIPGITYAILTGSDKPNCTQPINIEFIRLSYDIEAQIQRAYDVDMPEVDPYAIELRTALHRTLH